MMSEELDEKQSLMEKSLQQAVINKPGTFRQIFKRAYPKFRDSHAGGEEMARLKSHAILHRMNMRGDKITKEGRIYRKIRPRTSRYVRIKSGHAPR